MPVRHHHHIDVIIFHCRHLQAGRPRGAGLHHQADRPGSPLVPDAAAGQRVPLPEPGRAVHPQPADRLCPGAAAGTGGAAHTDQSQVRAGTCRPMTGEALHIPTDQSQVRAGTCRPMTGEALHIPTDQSQVRTGTCRPMTGEALHIPTDQSQVRTGTC